VGIIEPVPHDAGETRMLATLGRLTRGALHEISNPLVALLGTAELALGDVEIVRALQAFIRLQAEPPEQLSVGEAAAAAIALVSRVVPTHDVELTSRGDATIVAAPGELRRGLVELLVAALDDPDRGGTIELVVGDGVVAVTGGGKLRL